MRDIYEPLQPLAPPDKWLKLTRCGALGVVGFVMADALRGGCGGCAGETSAPTSAPRPNPQPVSRAAMSPQRARH